MGRDTVAYWKARLRQRTTSSGKLIAVYQVRIKFRNQEAWFNLSTENQDAAATKARTIYRFLVANGWEPTLEKYKPKAAKKIKSPTVGEFLGAISAKASLRPSTFDDYARKFRRLVAGIVDIEAGPEKHDYRTGGYKLWLDRVHAVKLSRVTPENVQKWKVAFLREHGSDPLALKRARTTVNTVIRSSKSLFSGKTLRFVDIELPSSPFAEVEFERPGRGRYRSEIDPCALMNAARTELGVSLPAFDRKSPKESKAARYDAAERQEQFKVFLLGLGAGLRRGEIDRLTWGQIDVERGVIRLETTEHGELKTAGSEDDVDVDPELLALLATFRLSNKDSAFVVLEEVPARKVQRGRYYRCERAFQKLTQWLRSKGVSARTPIHTLRKEFGSIVNQQFGIFAASSQLRHSSITLTRDVYTGKKARFAPTFGKPGVLRVIEGNAKEAL